MTTLKEIIGARLRRAREKAGLSREEVSARLGKGFSVSALQAIEGGRNLAKPDKLRRFAKLYEAELGWLQALDVSTLRDGQTVADSEESANQEGISDNTRNWDAEKLEPHHSPILYQDWSGELDPARFRRFVAPLIEDYFGKDALKRLKRGYFSDRSKDALKWLEECREEDPATPVTNHLGIYLQTMLGAVAHAETGELDLTLYSDQAHQTAALLLRPQKAGRKAE